MDSLTERYLICVQEEVKLNIPATLDPKFSIMAAMESCDPFISAIEKAHVKAGFRSDVAKEVGDIIHRQGESMGIFTAAQMMRHRPKEER